MKIVYAIKIFILVAIVMTFVIVPIEKIALSRVFLVYFTTELLYYAVLLLKEYKNE